MVKKYFKSSVVLLIIMIVMGMSTSCKNGKQLQVDLQKALNQQKEVKNYRFSGSANISLGALPKTGNNPLAASLLSFVKNSKLTWEGVSNKNPAQLEADFTLTPNESSEAFKLPILLKDNKLYFDIPLLSADGQYFVLDLQQLSKESKIANPFAPEQITNAASTTAKVMSILLSGIETKWLEENKDKTESDGDGKIIYINITEKNQKDIIASIYAKLPEVLDELQSSGFITADQAGNYKKQITSEKATHKDMSTLVKDPWKISVSIGGDGFIKNIVLDLNYNVTTETGTVINNRVYLQNSFTEINKNPKFTKEIPQNTVNIQDMLDKLSPPQQ